MALSNAIEDNDLVSYFILNVSMIDCTKLDSKFQQVLVTRLGDLHNLMSIEFIHSQHFLFVQLPLRGLVALFSLDRLSLTHENSVTEDFFHDNQ